MTLASSSSRFGASSLRHPMLDQPASAPDGGAQLTTVDGRSLPLVSATLRARAGGGLARVVLEQTFANPYEDTLRVKYKMPLPAKGSVSGYAFRIGARTITGKVDRKESARARFEEAITRGQTAALLEQDKADIFTQEIGNIPPGQTVVAEITVDQRLEWTPEGEWELRFPTVIGPRYIAAHVTPESARASHVEMANGSVRARLHLELAIADALVSGQAPRSPSHRLTTRADGVVELATREGERLDRDIVVRWPVASRSIGLSLHTARPAASAANAHGAYALLSVVPPAPDAKQQPISRDLIVLLDTSGSMGGPPLEQAKRVVASIIDSLAESDRLELIEFSNRPQRYGKHPVPAMPEEKKRAIAWVMSRQASGGTEMKQAVVDALHGLRAGAQRQVVLVTDGYIGGEEDIVTLLHESLPASCRLHVVGVGSAVNRTLAVSLARAGRGAEILVGLGEDAERSAKHLLDRTKSPVLTDVVIAGDAVVEHAPMHLPDVFAGAPLTVGLQIRPSGGEIIVRGKLANGEWEQRIVAPATGSGEGDESIAKLFARERVADLEMRWSIGREVERIDQEIESLGVVFQIATRRTSWVAIDEDRSVDPRKGSREEEIPQELPYGTTIDSFGPPRVMAAAFGGGRPPMAAASFAPRAFAASSPPPPRSLGAPTPRPASGAPLPPPPGAGSPYDDGPDTERTAVSRIVADESSEDVSRATLPPAASRDVPAPRRMAAPPAQVPAAPKKAAPAPAAPAAPAEPEPEPAPATSAPPARAMEPRRSPIPWQAATPTKRKPRTWLLVALALLFLVIAAIVAWLLSR